MNIRQAQNYDIEAISALAYSLTIKYITPEFPPAARDALLNSMTIDAIARHVESGVQYHVAESRGCIIGVVGIKDNRHLYHLFVNENYQRQGVARHLWQAAMQQCLAIGNPGEFTVNSSLYAKAIYEKLGFVAQSGPVERNGIAAIPMKMKVGN